MTDFLAYAALLEDALPSRGAAPVEKWDPPYRGDIDLTIRRDGVWIHEGAPIARAPLVRLFSTVLKREGERFFLVTPHEKLAIKVEDAPFLAVALSAGAGPCGRRLTFRINLGEEVVAGADHPIEYREGSVKGEKAPYLLVRRNLWARLARAAYYELVEFCETRDLGGVRTFGVESDGVFFPLEAAERVFGES